MASSSVPNIFQFRDTLTMHIARMTALVASVGSWLLAETSQQPALAADLLRPPIASASEQPLWTGFYIGAHVGGMQLQPNMPELLVSYPDDKSVAFGLKAGMNQQFGSLIAGLELDATFAETASETFRPNPGVSDVTARFTSTGIASLRGRLGYAFANAHVYLTAGAAMTSASFKVVKSLPMSTAVHEDSAITVGPVLGAGVEMRLSDNVSLNVEALQFRFEPEFTIDGEKGRFSGDYTAVRAGLTYHFR